MTGSGKHDLSDDELVELIREALRPPASVVEQAGNLWSWRDPDEELAQLIHDSLVEETAGMRSGAASVRTVSFAWRGARVEVQIAHDHLMAILSPPDAGELTVQAIDSGGLAAGAPGQWRADLGTLRFEIGELHRVRVRWADKKGACHVTPWLNL